ncbi:hypothetical protein DPMN_099639 [Dreissena polymorpha]|uniref:Uncharacterized protein n=1 Tax=Dreissena polymorpha TaxID=45954 RepID=A0A9D4R7V1_DREPO|nr:hypothetical protein DPMN_099639 [Dreissena polymorpha]
MRSCASRRRIRTGLFCYSNLLNRGIHGDHRLTKDAIKLQNKIRSIRFRPGATDKGFSLACNMLQSRGNRLLGLTIEKFTFDLTDGMSTDRRSTKREAMHLRSMSTVVVVGIR